MNTKSSQALLAEAVSHWAFPPAGSVIFPVAVNQGEKLRASAIYMGNRSSLQADLQAISVGQALVKHFGTLDDQHGLSKQSRPLGIRPTEPQITSGIAHYLQADGNRQKSQKRIQVFLHALLQSEGHQTNLLNVLGHLSDAQDIHVASEYHLASGRQIDLLIRWRMPGGKPYVVVIEAKFGHKVKVGQLPAYRQQVVRMAKGGDYATVLLTLDGSRNIRNKEWKALTWTTLLTRWEKIPAPDHDESFTLLKRMIWDRL